MLEEVAMQKEELIQQEVTMNRYPRRNRCAPDYYGAVILESQPFRRGSSVTGGSNYLGCRC